MKLFKIKNKNIILIIFIFFVVLLNAEVEVFISDPSYQLIYNENITISININGVEQAMRGFEIDLTYNTNYFYAEQTDFEEGDFLSNSNDETEWFITGEDGSFTITCAILGVTSGSIGSGTLFTLFLTNLNHDIISGTDITLSNVILRDILNNNINVDIIGNCNLTIDASPAFANFTMLLEGPYIEDSEGMMNHDLVDGGYIPTISPYDSENIGSLPNVTPKYIVDWIYIQLRLTYNGSIEKAANAFLLDDGSIVDINGNSSFPFYYTTGVNYYVVLSHRNHLKIMTKNSMIFTDNSDDPPDMDLTNSANVYGIFSVKELETGISGLYSGDADQDGQIFPNDRNDYWRIQTGLSGYKDADFNLDGLVCPDDLNDIWRINSGISSKVP